MRTVRIIEREARGEGLQQATVGGLSTLQHDGIRLQQHIDRHDRAVDCIHGDG